MMTVNVSGLPRARSVKVGKAAAAATKSTAAMARMASEATRMARLPTRTGARSAPVPVSLWTMLHPAGSGIPAKAYLTVTSNVAICTMALIARKNATTAITGPIGMLR